MKISWKTIGLLLVGVIVSAGLTLLVFHGLKAAGVIATPPEINATQVSGQDNRDIEVLSAMLKDEKLDQQTRQSLEKKLKMAEEVARLRTQTQMDAPKTSGTKAPTPLPGGDTTFPLGIFDGDAATFKPDDVIIQNRWQGIVNDNYLIVFAGSVASDEQQGIIIVRTTSPDRKNTKYSRYNAPGQTGKLKILTETNLVLTIQSLNGEKLTFNIADSTFLK